MSSKKDSSQKDSFLSHEGDSWLKRNADSLESFAGTSDAVIEILARSAIQFKSVLEIGCSNAWRLVEIQREFGVTAIKGIEPSKTAVEDACKKGISVVQGTADQLPFEDSEFDLVIAGSCLCVIDREDIFRVAAEMDRVVCNNGYIVIFDFLTHSPYKNEYKHVEGLYTYKMDYSKMFSWNPAYCMVHHEVVSRDGHKTPQALNDRAAVSIIKKSSKNAYPFLRMD